MSHVSDILEYLATRPRVWDALWEEAYLEPEIAAELASVNERASAAIEAAVSHFGEQITAILSEAGARPLLDGTVPAKRRWRQTCWSDDNFRPAQGKWSEWIAYFGYYLTTASPEGEKYEEGAEYALFAYVSQPDVSIRSAIKAELTARLDFLVRENPAMSRMLISPPIRLREGTSIEELADTAAQYLDRMLRVVDGMPSK